MRISSASFVLFSIVHLVRCYKILGLLPYPGKSHMDVILPLMKELSKRGHEVTVLSQYPLEESIPRYRDLSLRGSVPLLVEVEPTNDLHPLISRLIFMYFDVFGMGFLADEYCEAAFRSNSVKYLLASNETFDLIIHEPFSSDCLLALNQKFQAPIVGITTSVMLAWNNERFGNPDNPSYIPTLFMDYSDKLTFFQRVENTLVSFGHNLWYKRKQRDQDRIVRRFLGDNYSPLASFGNNMSLLLVNSHFSLNLARPFVPNVVEVGGLHLTDPKPLPKNIEKFINESTHGVIYFSLGSLIKGDTFPHDKRSEFLRAFARLPQRVLWKWENETMPDKPENVMIQKWMPQFDILSHSNVKAFISHGGLLSTTEAVHCGVPMVVMPQFGDQNTNAKAIEANGGGVILHLQDSTEEKVYQSLKKILNPKFRAKTKALSARFRDRPMSPMDTAIYWVEYVARHEGAPHMRTAAVDMPLFQYLLIDVLAFLAGIIIVLMFISYKISSLVFKMIFFRRKLKRN